MKTIVGFKSVVVIYYKFKGNMRTTLLKSFKAELK
jgi:hypothetical protein